MRHFLLGSFLVGFFLIFQGCGGGGDESDSGDVTTDDLTTLGNLPDIDLDSLDAATANVSASPNRGLRKLSDEEQIFSVAGCEARGMKDQFVHQVGQFKMNLCLMQAMETHAGVSVGVGSYNYYNISFTGIPVGDGGAEEDMTVRAKVGLVDDTMRLLLCEQDENGDFGQFMAMHFTVTGGKFDGQITDQHTSPYGDGTDGMRIGVLLETDNVEDFADGDTATITGEFASEMWGGGSMGLEIGKTGDTLYNVINGSFQSGAEGADWGNWTSTVYSKYDAAEGCSQYTGSGESPAMTAGDMLGDGISDTEFESDDLICWKEVADPENAQWPGDFVEGDDGDGMCPYSYGDTECFTFDYDIEAALLQFFVADESDAAYFGEVSGVELPDFEVPEIDFEGDDVWNCEPEGDFTDEIDAGANVLLMAAMDACFSFNESVGDGELENCWDQGQEMNAEVESGEELDDGFGDDFVDTDDSGSEFDCTEETDCTEILGMDDAVCAIASGDSSGQCSIECMTDSDCESMPEAPVCTDLGSGNYCAPEGVSS
ncbi:MAG: hypothetical protein Q7T11_07130 [Deltaproteobacteria bacterium]|nr:hypothetical protein [Deltaproteobacteria bacterium]